MRSRSADFVPGDGRSAVAVRDGGAGFGAYSTRFTGTATERSGGTTPPGPGDDTGMSA